MQAKQGYLDLLDEDPENIQALHFLAIIYAEEGELDQAEQTLVKAIHLTPNDATLHLHLANIYKAKGLYEQAIETLLKVIKDHPDFAASFNNLGTLYYAQQKWQEACAAYQKAIDLKPNYVDAYYNLGLALVKGSRRNESMNAFQAVIELSPEHPGAHFQLGSLLMEREKYQEAIKHFLLIAKSFPFHYETQMNLAASYLNLKLLNEAKAHYLQALQINENDAQSYFNLGVIHMEQGQIVEAIQYYSKAIQINPAFFAAHNNLGIAHLTLQNKQAALNHFQAALQIQPDNESIKHTIAILSGEKNISASPPEYIRSLFDSYADHYDSHLLKSLNYQVPQLFLTTIKKATDLNKVRWDILDLGCGTGLCGEVFKPYSRSLIGIDLSANMLTEASKKKLYDELIQADLLEFLQKQNENFDLIMAGDVLVYIGDLDAIFNAVNRALRPQGFFMFNAEMSTEKDFEMKERGRFVHSEHYLERIASQNDFTIVQKDKVTMRTENIVGVEGYIYLLFKG